MSVKTLSVLVAIGAVALASNPSEKSFKMHLESQMEKDGSSWFERKIVAQVTALVYDRKDFKFFTVVDIADTHLKFLGIFGTWLWIPSSFDELKMMLSSVTNKPVLTQ